MESFKKVTLLLVFSIMVFACQDDKREVDQIDSSTKKSIDYYNPFKNTIGFTDAETDEFVEIQKENLIDYWKNSLELDENVNFSRMELVEVNNGDESYLMLTAKIDNEGINVSSKLSLSDKGIMLSGETCKCKSGCEIISMCKCSASSRNETCKKTHTLTKLNRSTFQLIE